MEPTDRSLLEAMLADLEEAPPEYQPTHYWRICSQRLLDDLSENGLEQFRATKAPLTHFVPTYVFGGVASAPESHRALAERLAAVLPDDRKMRLALDQLLSGQTQAEADYRVYLASYRDVSPRTSSVSESEVGHPVGQLEFAGRRFSRSMLNYLLGLEFAKRQISDLPVGTVVELGGGFGTLGEILLDDPRNGTFYVDVDIPPTALYATYYLRQVLGPKQVLDYAATRELDRLELSELRQPGSAAVQCSWQLPRMEGPVDLFVNFISFQEMEPPVVRNYLNEARRLEARYVLLRNIREGREVAKDGRLGVEVATESSHYDRFLPDYELVASNAVPFGYRTVDGYHSELRLYALRP